MINYVNPKLGSCFAGWHSRVQARATFDLVSMWSCIQMLTKQRQMAECTDHLPGGIKLQLCACEACLAQTGTEKQTAVDRSKSCISCTFLNRCYGKGGHPPLST